jgi:uncharacterized membrane protein
MEENQTSPQTNNNQAESNVKAALTYLVGWLTGLIFLLTEKEDKFVRFHAAQSLVFFGLITLISIIPFLGQLLGLILWPLSLVLWVVLMFKAYKNEQFELPVLSDWAKQLEAKI